MPRQARTASPDDHFHSRNMIESRTPSSAIMEPTDSSMPPVTITNPRPMLKMPKAPISLPVFCRLVAVRKSGLKIVTMLQRNRSKIKMPNSFFIVVLPLSASCQMHHRFLAEPVSVENARDPAFVHHSQAVADAEDLFHFAADHDDADAL